MDIMKIPYNLKNNCNIGTCDICNSELDFEVREKCISLKECVGCRKSFDCWRGDNDNICKCIRTYKKTLHITCNICMRA